MNNDTFNDVGFFYKSLGNLSGVVEYISKKEVKITLDILDMILKNIQNQKIVNIYLCIKTTGSTIAPTSIRINDKELDYSDNEKIFKKVYVYPFNIDTYIHSGRNTIIIYSKFEMSFLMQIKTLIKYPIDQILNVIKECKKENAETFVKTYFKDTLIEKEKVSLCCPISKEPIKIPARSLECSHLDCFDLENCIKSIYLTNIYVCPCSLCKVVLKLGDIYIDPFYKELISKGANILYPDARYEIDNSQKIEEEKDKNHDEDIIDVEEINKKSDISENDCVNIPQKDVTATDVFNVVYGQLDKLEKKSSPTDPLENTLSDGESEKKSDSSPIQSDSEILTNSPEYSPDIGNQITIPTYNQCINFNECTNVFLKHQKDIMDAYIVSNNHNPQTVKNFCKFIQKYENEISEKLEEEQNYSDENEEISDEDEYNSDQEDSGYDSGSNKRKRIEEKIGYKKKK
jgi:hypothetical protein